MPEKLEEKLAPQQMADLFAFVRTMKPVVREPAGHRPVLVKAEAGNTLRLRAAASDIRGAAITFDEQQGCLVWHVGNPGDHVAWMAEVPKAGAYEVSIETAQVPENANNPFAIESGPSRLTGTLPSTGGWGKWQRTVFGRLDLAAGRQTIVLRPNGPIKSELSDVREVRLVLAAAAPGPGATKPVLVQAEADGALRLLAATSRISGDTARINPEMNCIAWMSGPNDRAVWKIQVPKAGPYEVWLQWAQIDANADNPFAVEAGASRVTGKLPSTGAWEKYRRQKFGLLQLQPGTQDIVFRPDGPVKSELSDLREIHLVPVKP
jgi:hypothetical protein